MSDTYAACFRIVCIHARRIGLPNDCHEPCAVEFLEAMYARPGGEASLAALLQTAPALVYKYAADFVVDYQRALFRLWNHEGSWPDQVSDDGTESTWEGPGVSSGVQERMEKDLLRSAIYTALSKLPPHHQEWFLLRYDEGQSINEIAKAYSRKPNTISQALIRICKKLAQLLLEAGWNEANLRELLSPPRRRLYLRNEVSAVPTHGTMTEH